MLGRALFGVRVVANIVTIRLEDQHQHQHYEKITGRTQKREDATGWLSQWLVLHSRSVFRDGFIQA